MAASVKRFNLKLQAKEPIQAFGGLEFRSPDRLWGDVNVALGAVSCSMHLDYRAATLDLQVHPFKITPSAARQWIPGWSLQPTLVASLSARGPLDELAVRWNLRAETAELEGVGRMNVVGGVRADLAILAHSLDLRSLFGIPLPSSIDGAVRLSLALHDSQPTVRFDGLIDPGYVAGVATPRIDIEGQLDAEGLLVGGRSNDPRLPIRAAMMLRRQQIDINAQLDHAHLERLLPADSAIAAHGEVGVRARAKVEADAITGELELTLKDVRVAAARVGAASLRAEFQGPLVSPKQWDGSLDLSATQVRLAPGFEFARVVGTATGGPQSAQVRVVAEQPGATKVSFFSNLRALEGPSLGATRLELVRGQRTLLLSLGGVSVDERTLVLNRLHLDGSAGKASGTLAMSPEHVYGQLTGTSINLTALSELLGLPQGLVSGTAAFNLDLDTRRRPAGGAVLVDFDRTSVGSLKQLSGQLELQLTGNQLKLSSHLTSSLIEQLDAQADVVLDGPPTQSRSYQHSTGNVTVDLTRIHLDRALDEFAQKTLLSSIAGTANVRLSVNRSTSKEQPSWTLSAVTNSFGATLARAGSPMRISGLDWLFSAGFRGDTSALRTDVVLYRDNQTKFSLNAAARMPPLSEWLDAYRSGFDWRGVPLEGFISMPRQPLTDWRDSLGFDFGTGTVESKLWLKGPVNAMNLSGELRGQDLLLHALGNTIPVNVEGLLEHGPSQTRLLVSAGSGQKTWLQLNAIGQLVPCPSRLLCIADWTGRAELGLLGLPLGNVPRLAELGISGEVRGALSARREAGLTRVNGVLPVTDLRMSGQALGQAVLHVLSDEAELIAGAKLLDANAQINLEAHVPMRWNDVVPTLHEVAPIRVVAAATGYDAAVIRPWIDDQVSDVGGELNGRLDATIDPTFTFKGADQSPETNRRQSDGPQVAVSGYVTLSRGRGTLRSMGLGFTDVSVAAQLASTGARTTISIPTISASSGSAQNNLNASAVVELENLSLKRLTARLGRAKDVPLPLNSTSFATLSGAADVEMTRSSSGFDVNVDFQDLELHLLRNSARQVVGLTENPDIDVLQPLGPDDWQKTRARAPTEFHVRVSLGGNA
ncbi:MAG TPA: hypothetical protein VKP30_28320, partial [Polyangiaceae bacterium]|nr:hypothetical protein [Polyangiaceae bacterium]